MVKESERQSLRKIIKNANQVEDISIVNHDEDKYYEVIDKHGITGELNDIIDGFNAHEPTKSSIFEKSDLNIGIICDEFLFYSLKNAANFVYIPYSNQMKIDETLDMLLVATSWRGIDHSWDYIASPKSGKRTKLINLINEYKQHGVPTVFYSKEDPVSYKEYLSLAKECDFIFTSAKEMINDYIRDTGNTNVSYLEFGVNPLYHNPIGKDLSNEHLSNIITFAGSWMVRFPERNEEALEMFSAVNKTDKKLAIVDRQYERKMARYHYPSFLIKNISETIPHERLMRLHKATNWGINLNSVRDSVTMFANRIYELQAMGNVVISNYNKGVQIKFPHIFISNSQNDIQHFIRTTTKEDERELVATGIREVMLNHTSYHRIAKLIQTNDPDFKLVSPKILIVGENEQSKEAFHDQSYKNLDYVKKENFYHQNVTSNYDFVAFFSGHLNYKSNYIENLLSAFVYTNSDIVTMGQDFYDFLDCKNIIKSLSMIKSTKLSSLENHNDEIVVFNIPLSQVESIEITDNENINDSNNLLSIVIPVKEDLRFLNYKSLLGLNNKYFSGKVNIVIVDNGRHDQSKTGLVKELKKEYDSLSYYYFGDKELEMNQIKNQLLSEIESEFVTFIKPQNQLSVVNLKEALHTLTTNPDVDVLISEKNPGQKHKETAIPSLIDQVNKVDGDIGGLIIRKSFLLQNEIEFNEELKNKELPFLIKVLKAASNTEVISEKLHHNYSVTFDLPESSYISVLNENLLEEQLIKDLLDEKELFNYTNKVFISNFIEKYIDTFKKMKKDKLKGLEILKEIYQIYETYYDGQNKDLNNFVKLLF